MVDLLVRRNIKTVFSLVTSSEGTELVARMGFDYTLRAQCGGAGFAELSVVLRTLISEKLAALRTVKGGFLLAGFATHIIRVD